MDQGVALLEIHLALKELQVVQKQILEKLDDSRKDNKDIDERLSKMETNWTILLGAAAPLSVAMYFAIDWIKYKMGITS